MKSKVPAPTGVGDGPLNEHEASVDKAAEQICASDPIHRSKNELAGGNIVVHKN